MEKLRKDLLATNTWRAQQHRPLEESKNQDESYLSSNDSKILDYFQHIRPNLIMYLKKQPIIDRRNEDILLPVFSMLKFSNEEIQDLKT